MAKLSEEEKLIRQAEREQKKAEREIIKATLKEKKPEPTEAELVRKYTNRVIKNQIYHGRVDNEQFKGLEHDRTVSKNLWMDTDFFFSVVFQSSEQKCEFLKKVMQKFEGTIEPDENYSIQILNGLDLAKCMGIELKPETTKEYPTGNLDLMPFCLDNEDSGNYQGE